MPPAGNQPGGKPSDAIDITDQLLTPGGKIDQQTLHDYYARRFHDDAGGGDVSVRFVLARDLNKRVDRYLCDRVPFFSRTTIQAMIRDGAVQVNGRTAKASTNLRGGDEVIAILPPPPSKALPEEDIPLDVLHEDEDLIVINKQHNLIVHPARGHQSGTLINALAYHFRHRSSGELSTVGEEIARPGVVHRLDRQTSGAIIAAKSDTAHWKLARQFEKRTTRKRYITVVEGRVEPLADSIELPLGRHMTKPKTYAVRWDDTGKSAHTIYRVREQYDRHTLVEIELLTGRTHQIRVHLSHLGWPIAADDIYGGKPVRVGDLAGMRGWGDRSPREVIQDRQALHAALIGFTHPITEEPMEIQAPLPPDMLDLVRMLRATSENFTAPNLGGTVLDLDRMIPSA